MYLSNFQNFDLSQNTSEVERIKVHPSKMGKNAICTIENSIIHIFNV